MKDTTKHILEASLAVFCEKGYISATTLEIALRAGVAEVTIFRQFHTKNNLFIETIKSVLGETFAINLNIDIELERTDFLSQLLHNKILLISKNHELIKMLIRETLSSALPKDLQVTAMIFKQVVATVTNYFKHHKVDSDPILISQLIVGILLRFAIMETQALYHLFDEAKQKNYISNYIRIINL